VVIGTVKGDLHDIGKNLVAMMLEGAGFQVVNLGVDVPAESFVAAVDEHQADIVGLSALLTTTIPAMERTTALIKQERPAVKVLVGGAPVNREYAARIGADAYAEDAARAAEIALGLMG
jgi:5-methyltetrahydrofolate--homocysteine methyltransferase